MGGAAVRSEAEVGAFFQAIGGDAAWAPQVLRYLRHKDGQELLLRDIAEWAFRKAADIDAMRAKLRMTRERFALWLSDIASAFPSWMYIGKAEERGITIPQLERVLAFSTKHMHRWFDTSSSKPLAPGAATIHHVNDWLVMPATAERNCAFVELVAEAAQLPRWFCCQWWGEPFVDFVGCLRAHQETRALPANVCYWVAAFALRQHSRREGIDGEDLAEAGFVRALRSVDGVLLSLDREATAFARAWCCFEVLVACCDPGTLRRASRERLLLDIAAPAAAQEPPRGCAATPVAVLTDGFTELERRCRIEIAQRLRMARQAAFPLRLLVGGFSVRVQDACCSIESDRRRILSSIAKTPEQEPPLESAHYDEANWRLRAAFAQVGWAKGGGGEPSAEGLHAVAAADHATDWGWDISFWHDLADHHLERLISAIPPHARTLRLRCFGTHLDMDAALASLGAHLPRRLERLQLDLSWCSRLGDEGLAALAARLPQELRRLGLDLHRCENLGDRGVAALSARLPGQLQHLQLSCSGCSRLSDGGIAALAAHLPQELQHLQLDASYCERLSDAALAALGSRLPQQLQHLHLDFSYCTQLGDAGFAALGAGIQEHLPRFELLRPSSMLEATRCSSAAEFRAWATEHRQAHPGSPQVLGPASPAPIAAILLGRSSEPGVSAGEDGIAPGVGDDAREAPAIVADVASAPEPRPPADGAASSEEDIALCIGDRLDVHEVPAVIAVLARAPLRRLQLDLSSCAQLRDGGLAALGRALPAQLGHLQLDLSRCRHLGDGGLAGLASGLPCALRHLQLRLFLCFRLGDAGVAALAARLPPQLRHLQLDLSDCSQVGDGGLAALAAALPQALEHLQLDLSRCPRLGDGGWAALGAGLPRQLRRLRLGGSGARARVGDRGLAGLCAQLPQPLEQLRLEFKQCAGIGIAGLAALGAGLPEQLQNLQLDFSECDRLGGLAALGPLRLGRLQQLQLSACGCAQLGDAGLAALASQLPPRLRRLRLDLFDCPRLGDGALAALGAHLPQELRGLQLDLGSCPQLGDRGLAALGAGLPKCLERLQIDFSDCTQLSDAGAAALAQPEAREQSLCFSGCPRVSEVARRVLQDPSCEEFQAWAKEAAQASLASAAPSLPSTWIEAAMPAEPAGVAEPAAPAEPVSLHPATWPEWG